MSKAEEILSAEFWCNENYNMKESGVISFEMMNAYANYITESRVNAISDEVKELKEFIIWMTGCGYDFTQHDYFIKQRDKLLKK